MNRLGKTASALVALLVSAGAAQADEFGCFARTYDKAHLAAHPDQIVTSVKLAIFPAPDYHNTTWFSMQFTLRGRTKSLQTSGLCNPKGAGVSCYVECDGGGMNIVPRDGSVMMHLDDRGIRVAECGGNVLESDDYISSGKDDRTFRLDRVNDALCRKLRS